MMRRAAPVDLQRTPTNMTEFAIRFHSNEKITGAGLGNIFCHWPCPFCGAPEFMVWEILDARIVMETGARCRECGRSAKGIATDHHGGVHIEIVQIGGPPQPEWLEPKMRRLS